MTRANSLSRGILPYLILLLGFCFTLLVYHYFSKLTLEQDRSSFDRSVQEIQDRVKARIDTSIALLRAGTGLFAASDSVEANEFDQFVQEIELDKNYPGVLGIGFSLSFPADKKDDVIAEMHRQGIKNFHVWPDVSPRSEYSSILYLQPATPANLNAIGFDMETEDVRRQAMDAARDSGKPTASGRVRLVQEHVAEVKQEGFLIYMPVYQKNAAVDTVAQRREALVGFVYSPYRVGDFLEQITKEKNYDVSFLVYDGTEVKDANLLSPKSNEPVTEPLFTVKKKLEIAGRTWTLLYSTKPSFEKYSGRSLLKYTVILGGLLSLLFFAVTRSEIRARTRAEQATEEVTASEATIRQTLHERERAEQALFETAEALRVANERALLEYERLLERIKALAQALGTARELNDIYRALRQFTNVSVPCNGFFVSLYDSVRDVRTACYGWADGQEVEVSELPPMRVTETGPNSRAVRTGEVIITNDYMRATSANPGVIVGPDNGLRPDSSMAVPMAVMGRIIGTSEAH